MRNVTSLRPALELWGGVECTINRVGDRFHDQYALSGHRLRLEADLELLAELGIKSLRAGLPWEHVEESGSWDFADRALSTMERCGVRPIAGLLHHGSGPRHTSLLDPAFPELFASFALETARRYPWVLDYTPINEPQTTGRFSCLYGHWYPHERSMQSYVRALYHQIKAIALAMQAIRSIQPEARLVHTEDAGTTFAAPSLEAYRVEREHRRWLGVDLLCGLVVREHPLYAFLIAHGLGEREILWFTDHPSPPSIVGLNYYVTSDRYLDDRLDLYPSFMRGGDTGREPLVDTEAVRVRVEGIAGAGAAIREAWQRYHLPVAITEAHLGDEPRQQARWLAQVWLDAQQAQNDGADVRAVTAWGLLGLFDWCNLCTRDLGQYEPGVFDVSSGRPIRTPLADLVQRLAQGYPIDKSWAAPQGWWHQDSRLIHGLATVCR